MHDDAGSYEIVVRGEIGPHFADVFDALTAERSGATTTLRGPVRDQAELTGILGLLDALGVEIVSVNSRRGARRAEDLAAGPTSSNSAS